MPTDPARLCTEPVTRPAALTGPAPAGAASRARTAEQATGHRPLRCAQHAAGTCRSCPHLDLPVGVQLETKQGRVAALLAAVPNPVPAQAWLAPAASAPQDFRNKAKMVVSGRAEAPVLGILDGAGGGVDLRSCPLHVPALRAALEPLAGFIARLGLEPYDVPRRRGELKHLLVTASPDGDLMVRFVLRSRQHVKALRRALPDLRRTLPGLAVASANIQPVHQAVLEGPEEVVLTAGPGGERLLMRLRLPGSGVELPLWLPTRSFFQTNTAVAQVLYEQARQWALRPAGDSTGPAATGGAAGGQAGAMAQAEGSTPTKADTQAEVSTPAETGDAVGPGTGAAGAGTLRVWDLFCGVGGFALALAGPGRQVLGVELSARAIDGARASARLMGLGPEQVRFTAGDARVLDPGAAPALGGAPHLLVVNPPRRGIGALAAAVEGSAVPRVLYSSCNPASLAADLEAMPSLRVVRARLFDMFPHTDHAEVLVELQRR